jgi:hypothetical protein
MYRSAGFALKMKRSLLALEGTFAFHFTLHSLSFGNSSLIMEGRREILLIHMKLCVSGLDGNKKDELIMLV